MRKFKVLLTLLISVLLLASCDMPVKNVDVSTPEDFAKIKNGATVNILNDIELFAMENAYIADELDKVKIYGNNNTIKIIGNDGSLNSKDTGLIDTLSNSVLSDLTFDFYMKPEVSTEKETDSPVISTIYATLLRNVKVNYNVGVYLSTKTADSYRGGLIGYATRSQVIDCHVTGDIRTYCDNAGGLAGGVGGYSTISYSSYTGTIYGTLLPSSWSTDARTQVGGICGHLKYESKLVCNTVNLKGMNGRLNSDIWKSMYLAMGGLCGYTNGITENNLVKLEDGLVLEANNLHSTNFGRTFYGGLVFGLTGKYAEINKIYVDTTDTTVVRGGGNRSFDVFYGKNDVDCQKCYFLNGRAISTTFEGEASDSNATSEETSQGKLYTANYKNDQLLSNNIKNIFMQGLNKPTNYLTNFNLTLDDKNSTELLFTGDIDFETNICTLKSDDDDLYNYEVNIDINNFFKAAPTSIKYSIHRTLKIYNEALTSKKDIFFVDTYDEIKFDNDQHIIGGDNQSKWVTLGGKLVIDNTQMPTDDILHDRIKAAIKAMEE